MLSQIAVEWVTKYEALDGNYAKTSCVRLSREEVA